MRPEDVVAPEMEDGMNDKELIAELVDALKGLMEGSKWQDAHTFIDGTPIGAMWSTIRMPTDEAMTAARAAIAKATGA